MLFRGGAAPAVPGSHPAPSTLTAMSDGEPTGSPDDHDDATPEPSNGRVLSAYGIASVALGVLSVAAIALGVVIWGMVRFLGRK